MKRTKSIDLSFMRKSTHRFSLRPLAIGVAAIVAGCSSNTEEVLIVSSVDDCVDKTRMTLEQCQVAYQQAVREAERTGPKYNRERDCEAEFGTGLCRSTSSGFFMPFMTGFLVSSAIDSFTDRRYHYNPVFTYDRPYSNYHNRIMTADGTIIGRSGYSSYKVPKKTIAKKMPKVTKTVSRGGFGSVASAKSSWGGGKSSRSWGG